MSATADYRADTTVAGKSTLLLKAPKGAVSQRSNPDEDMKSPS